LIPARPWPERFLPSALYCAPCITPSRRRKNECRLASAARMRLVSCRGCRDAIWEISSARVFDIALFALWRSATSYSAERPGDPSPRRWSLRFRRHSSAGLQMDEWYDRSERYAGGISQSDARGHARFRGSQKRFPLSGTLERTRGHQPRICGQLQMSRLEQRFWAKSQRSRVALDVETSDFSVGYCD